MFVCVCVCVYGYECVRLLVHVCAYVCVKFDVSHAFCAHKHTEFHVIFAHAKGGVYVPLAFHKCVCLCLSECLCGCMCLCVFVCVSAFLFVGVCVGVFVGVCVGACVCVGVRVRVL